VDEHLIPLRCPIFKRIFRTRPLKANALISTVAFLAASGAAVATVAQFDLAAIALVVMATAKFLSISVLLFLPLLFLLFAAN